MEHLKKNKAYLALGLVLVALLSFLLLKFFPKKNTENLASGGMSSAQTAGAMGGGEPRPEPVDLENLKDGRVPDVVVVSQRFSKLWKDILNVSFLKNVVNSDLVYFYEESENFLSLKGSIKRIAFEKNLTILDEVFKYVMDRPVQVAYWKAYHGRLDHFMGVTKKTGLTDLAKLLVTTVGNDKQLRRVEDKKIGNETVEVWRFDYNSSESLYFYAHGEEFVFYSNPFLPVADPEFRKRVFKENTDEILRDQLHTLFVSTKFLSFGYQFFTPGLDHLRFSYQEPQGWASALTDGKVLRPNDLLSAIPVYPAFCSFVPFSEDRVKAVFPIEAGALAKLSQDVGVCWYEDSKIFTPLVIIKTKEALSPKDFEALFDVAVGTTEKGLLTPEEAELRKIQIERLMRGENVESIVKATKFAKPFPVRTQAEKDVWRLVREVSSPHGNHGASTSTHSADMRSKFFFKVTLAQHKDFLIFSADDGLVDKAIASLQKRYPVARDLMKSKEIPLFLLDPARLAQLIKVSSTDSLPEAEEALFRESLVKRLFPVLEKLRKVQPFVGTLDPSSKDSWSVIQWRTFSSR